jgi:hypothetical protein
MAIADQRAAPRDLSVKANAGHWGFMHDAPGADKKAIVNRALELFMHSITGEYWLHQDPCANVNTSIGALAPRWGVTSID